MSQPPELPSLYQLRITLREISPLIWRRLLVCSDTTLAQLHIILQIVEGVSELWISYQMRSPNS
jgi:hypothetical protein